MSKRSRIFFGLLLIYALGMAAVLYSVVSDLDPRYRESAEESLVETSQLLATLIELTAQELERDHTRFGHVLESFVYGELLKATTTAEGAYSLMYYRDADKVEVDLVIENAAGQLVGVEVKASATVKESDLRGLRKLSSLAGDQFKMGLLLYDGDETLPLGHNIWAAPLASLWGSSPVTPRQYTP